MGAAVDLLSELQAAGVTVSRAGDRLRLTPPQAITRPLLEKVREHKAALLALVAEPAPLRCFTCRGGEFWRGEVRYADGSTKPGPWVCQGCHPPAPGAERGAIRRMP